MSLSFLWPIAVVVGGNIFYHICAKETPDGINALASLTITYAIAAVTCLVLFFVTSGGGNIIAEWSGINWATIVLGMAIVALEAGNIFMYRVGWNISTGNIVCNIALAVCLLIVGFLLYSEAITATKAIGILVCMAGLVLVNK